MRLITRESKIASRSPEQQSLDHRTQRQRRWWKGLIIESAEGTKFSYSSIPLPGFRVGTPIKASKETPSGEYTQVDEATSLVAGKVIVRSVSRREEWETEGWSYAKDPTDELEEDPKAPTV